MAQAFSWATQFYRVVNPECAIPAESIVIHRLRSEDVEGGEQISEKTLDDLSQFIEGAVLVGHFVDIDLKILRKEMSQTGHKFDNPAIDTARVHHWILRHGPISLKTCPLQLEKLDLANAGEVLQPRSNRRTSRAL